MRAPTPFDEMDALVLGASVAAGISGLTTHEAREFFRRVGRLADADRLHALLILLAADLTAGPVTQDVASAPK